MSTCRAADLNGSVEAEDGEECFVDRPHLRGGQPSDPTSEALDINSAELLDEHARRTTRNLDLRTERRRPGAARCRSDHHHRAGKQRIRLNHQPVPFTLLLVPEPLGNLEAVYLTPLHASTP